MKRKKAYMKPVILGFAALYLFSMILSTYLVKEKFEKDYIYHRAILSSRLSDSFGYDRVKKFETSEEGFLLYATQILADLPGADQYQQFSAAFYDTKGNKIAQTCNAFGSAEKARRMEDYLTKEEIERAASYVGHPVEVVYPDGKKGILEAYDIYAYYYEEMEGPGMMEIFENHFVPMEDELSANCGRDVSSWKWIHPSLRKVSEDSEVLGARAWQEYIDMQPGKLYLPCYQYGKDAWERWQNDAYLQEFPIHYDQSMISIKDYNESYEEGKKDSNETVFSVAYAMEPVLIASEQPLTIILRQTTHPWLAAMDYMGYVYAIGFLLTLLCMIAVIWTAKKDQERQMGLEQTRRDFTNAMAHELKTPLGVVRGFAENIKENTTEEKKEYYLDQIISQTEYMDDMVKEMILISKLDAEDLNLKKESVSLLGLAKEEMIKFHAVIGEKELKVHYEENENFTVNGDAGYLKKAVWNLLDNAVIYSNSGSSIWIFSDAESFSVENAGPKIAEEHLPYLCDMFYTGEESRNRKENHLGLGLYLVKKICDIHGLRFEIINTEAGVKASIYR